MCVPEELEVLVKDLQQFLGTFTDKLKGNAISHARIFVEKNGYLEEIKRMEVQEHTIIGLMLRKGWFELPMKEEHG